MSHTLSQPEEIDCVLMEMAKNGLEKNAPFTDKGHSIRAAQESWSGSYITPYRAALMRSINSLSNPKPPV
ncbi:MAG: hypothetical protein FD173_536 [Gallionellaceae bacterium]|nr:MAG: hypothetical protein FD173_536 [Gallionellaceae bacterium]